MKTTESLLLRLLHGIKVFKGCSHHHVRELLTAADRVDVKSGSYAVTEGDPSREFYVVISGEFSVVKRLSSGKQKVFAKLHPGDSFGEMSYLDGRPRSASVVADTDAVLIAFEHNKLFKFPESAAIVFMNLARMMAVRMRDSNALISLALEKKESAMAEASVMVEKSAVTEEGVPAAALQTHHRYLKIR